MVGTDPCARPPVVLQVLVSDPGEPVKGSLTALLSEIEGLSIFGCAQEPPKVVSLIQTVHPDVVVLDLVAARADCIEILTQIKKLPVAPMVIVLSAYDDALLRKAAITAGAEHFLVKTDVERLQQVLADVRDQRHSNGVDR